MICVKLGVNQFTTVEPCHIRRGGFYNFYTEKYQTKSGSTPMIVLKCSFVVPISTPMVGGAKPTIGVDQKIFATKKLTLLQRTLPRISETLHPKNSPNLTDKYRNQINHVSGLQWALNFERAGLF